MKKSAKRILCSVLSLTLASTLAVEHALRMQADSLKENLASTAAFKDVTGEFDTAALRQQYFNDSVLENTAPTYETRSVIVSLSEDNLLDAAEKDGKSLEAYMDSWQGSGAKRKIRKQQDAFLAKLDKLGIEYTLERRYDSVLNGVSIEVNTQYVSDIKKISGVESAVIAKMYYAPQVEQGGEGAGVINQTTVYETGIYDSKEYTFIDDENGENPAGKTDLGEGMVVAILDTGLDYTHEAFQNKISVSRAKWQTGGNVKDYVDIRLDELDLSAEKRSGSLDVNDVYVSDKVPFAYDYADNDGDVYPSYSNHGTHVAGIIGGYNPDGYTDKDGNEITTEFRGVVPEAQLVICKTFTDILDDPDLGGAEAEDIVAALDDCVKLGVDVINMSLGSSGGFSTTDDGDDEGKMLDDIYNRIQAAGISLVCAASNDYSAGYGGEFGTNLITNPDSGTVGSPSTFASALSVASISGQKSPYMSAQYTVKENGADVTKKVAAFYEESRDENGKPYDFADQLLGEDDNAADQTFKYLVIDGTGGAADYTSSIRRKLNAEPNTYLVLVKRGKETFQEKVEIAQKMKAKGIIVYNNVAGIIRMNLGEVEDPIPAVSVDMDSGLGLVAAAKNGEGKVTVSKNTSAGPFMSDFSSWGPTHDLKIKPEITAHGGEITSTVPGGYGEQSGTSMASPNMTGVMAIVRSYIEKNHADLVKTDGALDSVKINRLANQLIMSTATIVRDQGNRVYSPRKQGAGLGSLANVVNGTTAFLSVDTANDYRPKIELGEDEDKTGVYEMEVNVTNFGTETLTFIPNLICLTETIAKDGLAVAEQAYSLSPTVEWEVGGNALNGDLTVGAGETVTLKATATLSAQDKKYLAKFANGMYVEGYVQLVSETEGQCDLNAPYLAFYGDWEAAPMLDYTAYELAESERKDKEEEQLKASVWGTQPYSTYYNEKYVLPMGGYVYLVAEDDTPMYPKEEYAAVSRYNVYDPENEAENYLTSTAIKAVYAGLLRNARVVKYTMHDVNTGELILEDEIKRVSKAYAGGGSAVPANVELEISPEAEGLMSNGQYRMDFEFFMDTPAEGESAPKQNTYSFTFTVDYEAPVLEDVRIRYEDYEDDNGNVKQNIKLDIDVYDNHYPQAIMLCYPKLDKEGDTVLQLATEYPTPVRNPVRNGTSSVTIDITDIYEEYGDQLYLQIDDYAINSCLYQIDLTQANRSSLPVDGSFELAEGEEDVTVDIYGTHKVALVYEGDANLSNFGWTSVNPTVAAVKNGEIVGLKEGTTKVIVHDRNQNSRTINVTVTGEKAKLSSVPAISLNVIKTYTEALAKASGTLEVAAGEEFTLNVTPDPWYHPMTGLEIEWASSDSSVATVTEDGIVNTLKKGTAIISAKIIRNGRPTSYETNVTLRIPDPFDVSNYTLTRYAGIGWNREIDVTGDGVLDKVLVIPNDMNIMYIGEDAFLENENVEYVVLPASTIEIRESAFENCTALKGVFFSDYRHREQLVGGVLKPVKQDKYDSDGKLVLDGVGAPVQEFIDWSDLTLINEKAFYNCPNLEFVDFTNTKTITLATKAFADCGKLEKLIDLPSVGTMYHYAFENCVSLTELDLSGLYVSGNYVFKGCTGLTGITTGQYTSIGNYMFSGCTGFVNEITLHGARIGDGAFSGCVNLTGVKLVSPAGVKQEFEIGAYAFEKCGKNAASFTLTATDETLRVIGSYAFKGAKMASFTLTGGLEVLGENAFEGVSNVYLDGTADLEAAKRLGASFENVNVSLVDGYAGVYQQTNGIIYDDSSSYTRIIHANKDADLLSCIGTGMVNIAVADYAFAGNKGTTAIPETATLVSIGEGAFENSAIRSANLTGLTEIPARAFYNSDLQTAQLRDGVTVSEQAFAYSALTRLEIMGATRSIGDGAFQGCTALQFANLGFIPEVTDGMGDYVFAGCTSLTTAIVHGVERLGDYTFYGCENLESVDISLIDNQNTEEPTSVGQYAFMNSGVQSISLNGVTVIEDGAFYGSKDLRSVSLLGVKQVNAYAFAECDSLTSVSFDEVQNIGDYAFYGCDNLTIVALPVVIESEEKTANETNEAEEKFTVGVSAFENCEKLAYVNLNNVHNIGARAFKDTALISLRLDNVEKIGDGAFASISTISSLKIGKKNENENFVVKSNVIYRYVDKDAGTLALVCYPASLGAPKVEITKTNEDGEQVGTGKYKRIYTVEEGTVLIQGYAFYGLIHGAINEVVLPYSVKTIGDAAFFDSGIAEYTFESIQAPTLETVYRAEVEQRVKALADEQTASYYKGFYNANFETYFVDYSQYGTLDSKLIINYPENGKGYDNYLYRNYFGVRRTTGIHITDETRICRDTILSMHDAETVKGWLSLAVNAANTQMVKDFAEVVKMAHARYNNIVKDEAQLAFLGEENAQKLMAVEEQLREVKKRFNIAVNVTSAEVDTASTHRVDYLIGEKFDMTGLIINLIYDDYSVEVADASKLSLKEEKELGKLDSYVEVIYHDEESGVTQSAYVMINIVDELPVEEETPEEEEPKKEGVDSRWSILAIVLVTVAVVSLTLLEELVFKKRRKAKAEANKQVKDFVTGGSDTVAVDGSVNVENKAENNVEANVAETEKTVKEKKDE